MRAQHTPGAIRPGHGDAIASAASKRRVFNRTLRRTSLTAALALCCANNAGATDFIPQLKAHDKPQPFAIMPLYDLGQAGGEMPYVQEKATAPLGAVESITASGRAARVGTSYNGATEGTETFADVRLKQPTFFMRAIAVTESADDYETAAGPEQRFGYDRTTQQLVLGATPSAQREFKFVYVNDSIEDHEMPLPTPVAYAGLGPVIEGFGQDPIETDREIVKLMWDEQFAGETLKSLHTQLFTIELDRTANNYDLRPTTPATQFNEANVDRTMEGLNVGSELEIGKT